MLKAKIFYAKSIHPSEDVEWGKIYLALRKGDSSPIVVSTAKFHKYWREMITYDYDGEDSTNRVLERFFALFNDAGNVPNPLSGVEGQNRVRASGTHHTSMSVGDVVYLKGKYFIVASVGFKELKVN